MIEKKTTVYLSLGSNMGKREENLKGALRLLRGKIIINKVSSFYDTPPVGYTEQPNFINAVCEAVTSLDPEKLLILIKQIEEDMGRTPNFPNGPRIIDIDILIYGKEIIHTNQLTIPHPRMTQRAFVLIPFAEIAPDIIHPISHNTVHELLTKSGQTINIKCLSNKISD